jgi:hypothetical protein
VLHSGERKASHFIYLKILKKHPNKWEISEFSIPADDSVSGQLKKLIADARKSECFHEDHFEMLFWVDMTCSHNLILSYFHNKHLRRLYMQQRKKLMFLSSLQK